MNVSKVAFCATLKVNDNMYKKLPRTAPEGYPRDVIEQYENFLKHPVIKEMSEGDTVEISRVPYGRGYGVSLKIKGKNPDNDFDGGVFNSKNEANYTAYDLIFQTMQYLCDKYGIEQRMFERHSKRFGRLLELWKQMLVISNLQCK